MKITADEIRQVAQLSRLEFDPDDTQAMVKSMNDILGYMELLNQADTSAVDPMAHVLPLRNVMRADVNTPSLSREDALSTAPETQDGYFKVPKIMEG